MDEDGSRKLCDPILASAWDIFTDYYAETNTAEVFQFRLQHGRNHRIAFLRTDVLHSSCQGQTSTGIIHSVAMDE